VVRVARPGGWRCPDGYGVLRVIPLRDNLPTSRTPVVTIALIVANVAVYFLWQRGGLSLGDPSGQHYFENLVRHASIPFEITHPGKQCVPTQSGAWACSAAFGHQFNLPPTWQTVFTSMFMHGGLLHLGGNMLFLWIFGNNVEDSMGRVKFLIFYLLAGIAATALQVLVGPSAKIPNLGASGAIAGVLAAYLVLFPRARVATVVFIVFFFTVLELPAMIFLIIWFAQQALFGYFGLTNGTGSGGGVAYFAHIGGFLFGLVAVKLFADRMRAERQRWAARS
jgi:membrane associated rhomboid family serine protease